MKSFWDLATMAWMANGNHFHPPNVKDFLLGSLDWYIVFYFSISLYIIKAYSVRESSIIIPYHPYQSRIFWAHTFLKQIYIYIWNDIVSIIRHILNGCWWYVNNVWSSILNTDLFWIKNIIFLMGQLSDKLGPANVGESKRRIKNMRNIHIQQTSESIFCWLWLVCICTRWCPPSYKLVYNPNSYRYNPHEPKRYSILMFTNWTLTNWGTTWHECYKTIFSGEVFGKPSFSPFFYGRIRHPEPFFPLEIPVPKDDPAATNVVIGFFRKNLAREHEAAKKVGQKTDGYFTVQHKTLVNNIWLIVLNSGW